VSPINAVISGSSAFAEAAFSFVVMPMPDLIQTFTERGDLAHLALLLWAMSASALAWFALRELTAASRRFDDFVRELARFNEHFGGK
jgi:hypothetical protein